MQIQISMYQYSEIELFHFTGGSFCSQRMFPGPLPSPIAQEARYQGLLKIRVLGRKQLYTNGSDDYGLMQINSYWEPTLRRMGIPWDSLADPCTNVTVGAWVLSQCFQLNSCCIY